MAQINLILTAEFKKDLEKYMKHRKIPTKSEAIRAALQEVVMLIKTSKKSDYLTWLGAGLTATPAKDTKFRSEDDLWGN